MWRDEGAAPGRLGWGKRVWGQGWERALETALERALETAANDLAITGNFVRNIGMFNATADAIMNDADKA